MSRSARQRTIDCIEHHTELSFDPLGIVLRGIGSGRVDHVFEDDDDGKGPFAGVVAQGSRPICKSAEGGLEIRWQPTPSRMAGKEAGTCRDPDGPDRTGIGRRVYKGDGGGGRNGHRLGPPVTVVSAAKPTGWRRTGRP